MTDEISMPPLCDLPAGHLELRKRHLASVIRAEPGGRMRHSLPDLPLRRLRFALPALAAIGASAAIAIAVTWREPTASTSSRGQAPISTPSRSGSLVFPPRSATVGDLAFDYPEQYSRRYFTSTSNAITRMHGTRVRGVVVASYTLAANPEVGGAGASLRTDGVLFELYKAPTPNSGKLAPTVTFPVKVSRFHRVHAKGSPRGDLRELSFSVKGTRTDYVAIAWIGSATSKAEQFAISSFIGSLRVK